MQLPHDLSLPFFAYGLFKPGQLAFSRIAEYVERHNNGFVKGRLLERDGLPLLSADDGGEVKGVLLFFTPNMGTEAYQRIIAIEPDKQYRWHQVSVKLEQESISANALAGREPRRGSVSMEESDWDGRRDPLFTSALEVVKETLEAHSTFEWDLKPLFRLQMGYLLLWSAIERYTALKYHLGGNVTERVFQLADEPAFTAALRETVHETRELFRADRPENKCKLDPASPEKSLKYYYQVRSNITHRGKAVVRDHEIVQSSLKELLAIFERVLAEAFSRPVS